VANWQIEMVVRAAVMGVAVSESRCYCDDSGDPGTVSPILKFFLDTKSVSTQAVTEILKQSRIRDSPEKI
jgi:hypothetical protein